MEVGILRTRRFKVGSTSGTRIEDSCEGKDEDAGEGELDDRGNDA